MRPPSLFGSSPALTLLAFFALTPALLAQDAPSRVEFDAVSIKRHDPNDFTGVMRTLPDGTFTMTGMGIDSIISMAAPRETRDVDGLPTWAKSERYDITAKPPANSTRDQIRQMWQAMFADRMKLAVHVEEREQNTFALVLDRSDGRLGPNLKPSTPTSPDDYKNTCGGLYGQGMIVTGSTTMDRFVLSQKGLAGGEVVDRTGLTGAYALELRFAEPRTGGGPNAVAAPDDAPEFLTALREQLGLTLVPQKSKVPVLVIDHIERPSEN